MKSNGPVEAGGHPERGAIASVAEGCSGFSISRLPRMLFGPGRSGELGAIVREFGSRALVVVRGPGFTETADWARLRDALESAGVSLLTLSSTSPAMAALGAWEVST